MELTDTADTVKHTEESVWADFKTKATMPLPEEKQPNKVLNNNPFTPSPKFTITISVPVEF
jgi:hypothetical protein